MKSALLLVTMLALAQACSAADTLDTSGLPETVTMEVVSTTPMDGLILEMQKYQSGERLLMGTALWLSADRKRIVKVGHMVHDTVLKPRKEGEPCLPVPTILTVNYFNEGHRDNSAMVHTLPAGCTAQFLDADEVSGREWRIYKAGKLSLCLSVGKDGVLTPLTRAEFEKVIARRLEFLKNKAASTGNEEPRKAG